MQTKRSTHVGKALAAAIQQLQALQSWPVAERPLFPDDPTDLRQLDSLARAVAHCVDPVIRAIADVAEIEGHKSVLWDALDGELSYLLHERAEKYEEAQRPLQRMEAAQ